jgi:hypothetical protein
MIKLSLSRNKKLLKLIAYEQNVYQFKFTGDKTYTDSMGVIWNWEGVEDVAPTIFGIRAGEQFLFSVASLADCIATPGSYHYASPRLYVHWPQGQHDIGVSRALAVISVAGNIDVADSFRAETLNWEGELFYTPSLDSVSDFNLSADPLKLSIIQSFKSTATINNSSGGYNNLPLALAKGAIMQVSDDDVVIFKGITEGADIQEDKITITAQEQRFFQNPRVCQNFFTADDYPGILDRYVGTPIPVAIGKVNNIGLTPINTKGLDNSSAASVFFLVSDPAYGKITSAGVLTGSNGINIPVTSFDPITNLIEYSKPADSPLNLEQFTWSGQVGAITDGLGIIQYAYQAIANYPFLPGLYDVGAWNIIRASAQQQVGVYATGTKDLISAIIEPICTSLQVMILTNRVGEITAVKRGFNTTIKKVIDEQLMEGVSFEINSESFVPEIVVGYGTNSDIYTTYSGKRDDIIAEYGNVANGSINPVKTVLANFGDAYDLSIRLMDTSQAPEKIISFATPYNVDDPSMQDLKPFDMITAGDFEVEVYSIVKSIYTQRVTIRGRITNG